MHVVNNGSPLYCAESNTRMGYYQSPYYTPWLYRDGVSAGSGYTGWRSGIVTRMNQPSTMTLTVWGFYNPGTRAGTIYARYRNDSTVALAGRAYFVITEDSCYYAASNGDLWHNHVARDYLPGPTGTAGTINAGDSMAFTQAFTINSAWNASRCKIVMWFQLSNGSRTNIQAGIQKVTDLPVGIEEITSPNNATSVTLAPNPCLNGTTFRFQIPLHSQYTIKIFDISGRCVRTMSSVSHSSVETCAWNLRADQGDKVNAGVYLYKFESEGLSTNGKIVVR